MTEQEMQAKVAEAGAVMREAEEVMLEAGRIIDSARNDRWLFGLVMYICGFGAGVVAAKWWWGL